MTNIERQLELELSTQVDLGVERFKRTLRKEVADGEGFKSVPTPLAFQPGASLLNEVARQYVQRIASLQKFMLGRGGDRYRGVFAWELFLRLPAESWADAALSAVLSDERTHTIGAPIGTLAHTVVDTGLLRLVQSTVVQTKADVEYVRRLSPRTLRRALKRTDAYIHEQLQLESVPPGQRAQLGTELICLLDAERDYFGLDVPLEPWFRIVNGRSARPHLIILTDEAKSALNDRHERMSLARPLLLPMLVRPRPWQAMPDKPASIESIPCVTTELTSELPSTSSVIDDSTAIMS